MNIQKLINDSKTTIVDVRTEEEFLEGNVNGSINIPLDEVSDRVEELKQMQPLVLCCLSGGRSGQATDYLQSLGCKKVYNGGGWEEVITQQNKN
ncbi:MAG TPA: rhodanese-like domain-containing protein [Flavobacteriales bacterium]|jgi:rhodanese-related sulfurtransferase|nr:rhodanese-like domain-containing protein [Flavobacteriales bacterium]